VPRAQALRAKLEAVGWVMVRFLRRGHSLDKTGSHNSNQQQQRERHLDRSGSDTGEMHESLGNGAGGTPPLPNGRAAAAGAARSRLGRDGPPSGTIHHGALLHRFMHRSSTPPDFIHFMP
jgi:hypothetical protein